ncbi:MAG TPA: FAD-dependent oxidoreductase, partial [Candidatus Limnocylindria bacterium]|nr:FAD-dependent oxidoreductase [Candidatus Limnocylindria bacterium]
GRRPNLANLGLEEAGIDTSGGAIAVDERMRAGEGIWAMGDVAGKGLFTHLALAQAHVVEADILGREVPSVDYAGPPAVTFTDPEVASVGMREAQARQADLDVAVSVKPMQRTFRGWIHGTGNEGLIKLVADRRRGVLVGATCVGPHAGEVLGLLGAAVQLAIPLADLGRLIYAFPTFYGGVGEALGAYARALVQVLDPEAQPLAIDG